MAASVRNPLVRLLALLWGPAIGLAVVATGNHFVFDIAAGLVASVAGYALGTVAARATAARSPRTVRMPLRRPVLAEA